MSKNVYFEWPPRSPDLTAPDLDRGAIWKKRLQAKNPRLRPINVTENFPSNVTTLYFQKITLAIL